MDPVANVPRTTPPAPAVLENAQRQPAGPHAAAAFAPVSTPYGVVAGVGRRGGVLARRSEESWALSTDYAAVQTQRSVGTRLLAALAANLCPSSHRLRPRAPGRAPGGESCLLRHTLLHTSRDAHCQSRISRYTPEAVCGRSARMFMADRVGQAWVRW